MTNKLFSGMLCAMLFSACTQDDVLGVNEEIPTTKTLSVLSTQEAQIKFAKILSKAVASSESVRSFLKQEALSKIDNGYNIFYPIAKDKILDNRTFKNVLSDFEEYSGEIEEIENKVPLLNIHIPEIATLKVSELNISDNEIPVLYQNQMYFNGNIIDTLATNEVPGFYTFVVSESNSIQVRNKKTRCSNDCYINDKYEYVDYSFVPNKDKSLLSRSSVDYDKYDIKYSEKGYVPESDIDPLLVKAYKNSSTQKRSTRYLMYYDLQSTDQNPNSMRSDVSDCIFRFKIAPDAFKRFEDIADGKGNPLFNGNQTVKKRALSREEAIKRLLTGRAFCFLFKIEGTMNGTDIISESMKIYATPEKIFNLCIKETKRHKTMFRHSKYTYSIDEGGIKSKWFYPLDHGHDTRLNKWDIATDPIEKKVIVYIVNPDEGFTKEVTETYSVTYITNKDFGGDISIPIDKIKLGINGKLNSSNTTSKTVTTHYKVTETSERIDDFQFNYFDDYPIENIDAGRYVIPIRKGKGVIETSIMPISNKYFNQKRFEK